VFNFIRSRADKKMIEEETGERVRELLTMLPDEQRDNCPRPLADA
jgi:hypothetical protein